MQSKSREQNLIYETEQFLTMNYMTKQERMNYMGKSKLNPVKVPWKISASDEIALFQCENDRLEILLIADLFDSFKLKN